MSPKPFALALLLLIFLKSTEATIYQVIDRSDRVPGGNKYADELNSRYKARVLFNAVQFVLKTFNQTEGEGKNYDRVILLIKSFAQNEYAVASTTDNLIRLNADYLLRYRGDIREEFAGVVYHEMTRVWQWTGNGMAPTGLISGIADYVRLKGGYASKGWPAKAFGVDWDFGYSVTAHFLEYCSDLKHGIVAELNALMKDSYSEAFFVQLLGKSVHELWRDYQLASDTTAIPGSKEGYRKLPASTSGIYNYTQSKPVFVAAHKLSPKSREKNYDSSRVELTGVTLAETAKGLVKNLGNCNGFWSCLLAKVSAMIEKISDLIHW